MSRRREWAAAAASLVLFVGVQLGWAHQIGQAEDAPAQREAPGAGWTAPDGTGYRLVSLGPTTDLRNSDGTVARTLSGASWVAAVVHLTNKQPKAFCTMELIGTEGRSWDSEFGTVRLPDPHVKRGCDEITTDGDLLVVFRVANPDLGSLVGVQVHGANGDGEVVRVIRPPA